MTGNDEIQAAIEQRRSELCTEAERLLVASNVKFEEARKLSRALLALSKPGKEKRSRHQEVADLLKRNGPMRTIAISAILGRHVSNLSRDIKAGMAAGLIKRQSKGIYAAVE